MLQECALWERTKCVVDSIENHIAKSLQRDHGLGLKEYQALRLLSEAPDSELRMQELTKLLGLNQSSVSRLVERLEKGGYTIRDICPNDKRGVYTVLTGRGREIQSRASGNYVDYISTALNNADFIEENREIVQCLRQLVSPINMGS